VVDAEVPPGGVGVEAVGADHGVLAEERREGHEGGVAEEAWVAAVGDKIRAQDGDAGELEVEHGGCGG